MASAAGRPDATGDQEGRDLPGRAGTTPAPDAPGETEAIPPTGLVVTDSWAEAADPTGTVRATRQMPEPDSLGG